MFVGHGMVAFALVASVATRRGWQSHRALQVGLLAGLFATLPDVDMAYALLGVLGGAEGVVGASDAFWAAARSVHRGATHSLVVGAVSAVGFAAWHRTGPGPWYREGSRRWGAIALATFGAVGVGVSLAGGPIALGILALFLLGGLVLVRLARMAGFSSRVVLLSAMVGLLSHPFGDLLTGSPPAFFFPVEWTLLTERVALHPDPTLHLLAAFFVELAAIWVAVIVLARHRGWRLAPSIHRRATLGIGYAGAVFAIPAPSVDFAWPFVITVLAISVVGVPVGMWRQYSGWWRGLVTALAAVTLAGLAYTSAYLAVA